MAFILGQTLRGGKRIGFIAMFGLWVGAFSHVLFAVLGLSAILAASSFAFGLVKWAGVFYLVWLGIQALTSKEKAQLPNMHFESMQSSAVFKQGVFIAALNPKVAIFFLAFLPQFVVPGAGPESAQLFLHGSLIILVAGIVEPPVVLLGAKLNRLFRQHNHLGAWLEKTLGAIFIALAIRLALSESV